MQRPCRPWIEDLLVADWRDFVYWPSFILYILKQVKKMYTLRGALALQSPLTQDEELTVYAFHAQY